MTPRNILTIGLVAVLIILPVVLTVSNAGIANTKEGSRGVKAGLFANASIFPWTLSTASSTQLTGVIIPLYTYPTSPTWQEVIQAKIANPPVPVMAVINPNSGPGGAQDQNYVGGINSLRSAGVIVLGYVHTSYAQRSLSSVEADIALYQKWYNVTGIFFDEMSNAIGNENYYSSLNTYAKSLGYTMTVGNPGASVPESYVGTLNVLCIYENQGLPSTSGLLNWTGGNGKQNFATISYGVSSFNSSLESAVSSYVGWIYITSAGLPNPYNMLPSYFSSEVATLNTGANTPPIVKNVSLAVNSFDLAGARINGPWATIQSSNGTTLAAGFTPLNYTATAGATYVVTVSNSSLYRFDHWSNGSVRISISVTPTQATTLSAYYNAEISTSTTTSPTIAMPQVTSSTTTSSNQSSVTSSDSAVASQSSISVPAAAQLVGVILMIGWMLVLTIRKPR